jgi:hypothetical protein
LPGDPSSAPPARRACQGPRAPSEAIGPHRRTPEALLPLPRPPLKAAHRPPAHGHCTPASCRAPVPEHPPPLAHVAQSSASLAATHGPYDFPSTTVPPARPGTAGQKAAAAVPPWAQLAGRPPVLLHPSTATNRSMVSPSTFSTHPPADSPTGMAQFRRAAPPSMARDNIVSLPLIPGCFS